MQTRIVISAALVVLGLLVVVAVALASTAYPPGAPGASAVPNNPAGYDVVPVPPLAAPPIVYFRTAPPIGCWWEKDPGYIVDYEDTVPPYEEPVRIVYYQTGDEWDPPLWMVARPPPNGDVVDFWQKDDNGNWQSAGTGRLVPR